MRLLFILLFILPVFAKAQLYPVQVSVSTTPPYYNFLTHYGDQNNHLLIIATLTDFNSPPINARLRLKIEGQGFVVQTRQDIPVGNVFTLEAGFPVFIQGSDVLPLLQESNLAVVSGNPNLNNLLEGFTTICVEVVEDGANQTILATNNCTAFFLQLMQPPQAFLPICNSIVDTNAMFQTFQWSPPQNYIPSIGTDLNYTFSLYEWIDTTNYNIFQTGQGLVYQTQTPFAMAQVSNFDVLFQKGVKYIWRVQAELTSNGVPVQMITNNGISAPCSFYYGQPQSLAESLTDGLVINLTCDAPTSRKGRASWTVVDQTPNEGLSGYNSYKVEVRRKPYEGETTIPIWHTFTESGFQQLFYQVVPEETYQVRVSGVAGDFVSEPTEIVEFTTPAPRQYACGEVDLPYMPANYQPLVSAHMGDAFQIGQFTIEVTSIIPLGTLGHYKGRGTIPHGFIGGARIKVQFDDLLVDTEYRVREGQASAISEGLDNWLNEQYLDNAEIETVDGVIESGGFLNDSTVFVVVNGDSLFFTFNGELPIVIHGENNVEYQFWSNGTMVVTTYGVTPSTDSLDATRNLVVRFEPISADPVETNLFDKKEHDQFSSGYEAIVCQSNSPQNQFIYFVSNKSKEIEGTAQVKAIIHVNTAGFVASGLSFKIAGGITVVPHTVVNDSTFLLTLPAKSYNYSVYAMYDELKLGKLNVKCYAPITKKVRIVPLVSMSLTETQIETALNTIYKGANLSIDASIAPQFNTPEFTTTTQFANPDVSLMSKYTAQMRALREAYLETNEVESGTYLVFIVPSFENSQLDGYMVRGRGVGFIAQSTVTNISTFSHTLAHELGHGIGGLEHAWGENESLKNGTDNLMDYSNGTRLIKEQWEQLRNPNAVLSLFDSEEDGESQNVVLIKPESFNIEPEVQFIDLANYSNVSDFVFRAKNGLYFKFNTTNIPLIETVYFEDGFVVQVDGVNGVIYLPCISKYNRSQPNVNIATLSFHSFEDTTRFHEELDIYGNIHVLIDSRPDDILFNPEDILLCASVSNFVSGITVNNAIEFTSPICPPENNETNSCDNEIYPMVLPIEKQFVKQQLEDLVSLANANSSYDPLKAFQFSGTHVINYFTPKEKLVIREKVNALYALRPNIVIAYILTENLDSNKIQSSEQLTEMAQYAVQQVKAVFPNKDIALLLFNTPKFQQSGYYTHHDNCGNIGFAVSDPTLIKAGTRNEDIAIGSPFAVFQNFFAHLKKPYKIYNFHELYNGNFAENIIDRTQPSDDIYGSPFVCKSNFLVSKDKEQYIQKLTELAEYKSIVVPENPSISPMTPAQYLAYTKRIEFQNFLIQCETNTNFLDPERWIREEVITDKIDNIKESMLNRERALAEVDDIRTDLLILNEMNLVPNVQANYYEFNEYELMDKIIYGIIDVMGCIPLVDYIADGAGILYSSIRGNGTNVVIYSAALAIPFAGAAVVKQGQKAVAYFVKKVDATTYLLTARNMDEVMGAEWVRISDEIPVEEEKVVDALADLNSADNLNRFTPTDRRLAHDYAMRNSTRIIAQNGEELAQHLNSLVNIPAGVTYNGSMYRSIGTQYNNPLEIHSGAVASNYRYSRPSEGALYLSKTHSGNLTEISSYGSVSNYNTYEYANVQINNMLDLTDDMVRQQLSVEFGLLTRTGENLDISYEFTHVLGTWANARGYNGIIAPGARGSQDYINIIIFDQSEVNATLGSIIPIIHTN